MIIPTGVRVCVCARVCFYCRRCRRPRFVIRLMICCVWYVLCCADVEEERSRCAIDDLSCALLDSSSSMVFSATKASSWYFFLRCSMVLWTQSDGGVIVYVYDMLSVFRRMWGSSEYLRICLRDRSSRWSQDVHLRPIVDLMELCEEYIHLFSVCVCMCVSILPARNHVYSSHIDSYHNHNNKIKVKQCVQCAIPLWWLACV